MKKPHRTVSEDPTKPLTIKESLFVKYYRAHKNGTQAAKDAGYSAKSAASTSSRLIRKANVQRAIAIDTHKVEVDTGIDAAYVLTQAAKLHVRCMGEEVVLDDSGNAKTKKVKDSNGVEREVALVYPFNAAGAAQALTILGKHTGVQAFEGDKEEGKVSGNFKIEVAYVDKDGETQKEKPKPDGE